ncbi:GNAT domain-containing protein [Penicillium sp. IBT 35674x]|nr:GNAT domain-containing protein [Penicillium sp. IBT 35674x]
MNGFNTLPKTGFEPEMYLKEGSLPLPVQMAASGTSEYPSMQTPRLNLVRLTPEHLGGYHAIWSDPVATR